jgi:hypothetical protein
MKAWPSRKRIEREMRISSNTLSKYLRELSDHGLIEIQQTRVVREGRSVYGNNVYVLRFPTNMARDTAGSTPTDTIVEEPSGSVSYPLDCYAASGLRERNTNSSNNTISSSVDHLSTLDPKGHAWSSKNTLSRRDVPVCAGEAQSLPVDVLIWHWNAQGVNPHHRLGSRSRWRLAKALEDALEDFSEEEILGAISTYSKLFSEGRCDHKYRLVEFMEKRGYEVFQHEGNWRRRASTGHIHESVSYTPTHQDRRLFSFLDNSS